MSLLSKWTLGGGIAVAAIVAAFSLFGGTASAGLDDPGELIRGDLECEKSTVRVERCMSSFGGGDEVTSTRVTPSPTTLLRSQPAGL